MPPKDSYCVVNGPPKSVHESLDIAHPTLCLCMFFLEKRSLAFWSIYGSYVLLKEKYRCECSDVRASIHGRPTPEADTSIQLLCAIGSEEEKPFHS